MEGAESSSQKDAGKESDTSNRWGAMWCTRPAATGTERAAGAVMFESALP